MSKTIVIGDVHGCLEELESLLGRVHLHPSDRVYFVGDLVGRGPSTLGVLALAQSIGAVAVRGNHEAKLIDYHDYDGRGQRVLLGPNHVEIARCLSEKDWDWLRAMPFWYDLAEHDMRIVHAGVLPGKPVEETDPLVLMTIRSISPLGDPTSLRGGDLWGRRYQGPPHIVFGHNALMHPQYHVWATGIDLGCVYGGFLAAFVLEENQPVPPIETRARCLVTVPARKAYYPVRARYRRER